MPDPSPLTADAHCHALYTLSNGEADATRRRHFAAAQSTR
jgi:hypothetical protein